MAGRAIYMRTKRSDAENVSDFFSFYHHWIERLNGEGKGHPIHKRPIQSGGSNLFLGPTLPNNE